MKGEDDLKSLIGLKIRWHQKHYVIFSLKLKREMENPGMFSARSRNKMEMALEKIVISLW